MIRTILIISLLYAAHRNVFAQERLTSSSKVTDEWRSTLTKVKGSNYSLYYTNTDESYKQYDLIIIARSSLDELPKILNNTKVIRMVASVYLKETPDGSFSYNSSSIRFTTEEGKRLNDNELNMKIRDVLSNVKYDVFIRKGLKTADVFNFSFVFKRLK